MNDSLLPFPESNTVKTQESTSLLPDFPDEIVQPVSATQEQVNPVAVKPQPTLQQPVSQPLTSNELVIVRQMIADYKSNQKKPVLPDTVLDTSETKDIFQMQPSDKGTVAVSSLFCEDETSEAFEPSKLFQEQPKKVAPQSSPAMAAPATSASAVGNTKKDILIELLSSQQKAGEADENEFFKKAVEIVKTADEAIIKQLSAALLGIFPCKKYIRHGTPEQKLFVLKSLGERFLSGMASIKWSERKKLNKVIAAYLSSLSEDYNFLSMEGEIFKPTFYERVAGSSASGTVVKEMRSFLIVHKNTNRVMHLGLVLA